MSKLKEKSISNFDAAKELISKQFFAPSVHCSYYSCFQLMKVIVHEYDGITYDDFATKSRNENLKSHQFVINKVKNHIYTNAKGDYRDFNNKINELKTLRETADYDNVEIRIDKANNAMRYAETLRSKLQEIFTI